MKDKEIFEQFINSFAFPNKQLDDSIHHVILLFGKYFIFDKQGKLLLNG